MPHSPIPTLLPLLTLAACATPLQTRSTPQTPLTFATQLAAPSTYLAPMPTAVILLKPDDLNRNRAFCTAFTTRLPTAESALAAATTAPNLILTRWLVQLPTIPPDRTTDCDFLVGTYDYARATRLLSALHPTEGQLTGPGPFLLMAVPDTTGLHFAGLDGSQYAAPDFPRFIETWSTALRQTQNQLSRTPDQPGVIKSLANLIAAILRTAAGATTGLIRGALTAL